MKPRIYTYKITFPYQKWWYWGVHKEKTFGDSYDGSPSTHAEKWKKFEFEKQILEFFDDWDVARSVEKRLIDPDLNNPLCLNENSCGGFSLEANSKGGRKNVESGHLESLATFESCSKGGKIGGRKNVESGHLQSISSKGGKKAVESGQIKSISTPESCSKGGKISSSQKWRCLVTGHISNPGPLSRYQKARGIDTSLRERVKTEGVV